MSNDVERTTIQNIQLMKGLVHQSVDLDLYRAVEVYCDKIKASYKILEEDAECEYARATHPSSNGLLGMFE